MGTRREPRGIPSGGQFAATSRSESEVDLGKPAPRVTPRPPAPKPAPPVKPVAQTIKAPAAPVPAPETTVAGGLAAVGRRMRGDMKGVVRFGRRKADEIRNQ